MKKKLLLGLLCVMAAVPVGMDAMEEGAQANAGINLSARVEADINKKLQIISTTIFKGSYVAACTMYHTSLSNLKKDYSDKEQANALTVFNQKVENILTSVIPELIKNENDKALYAFKQIIDQNQWPNLQQMVTSYIQDKRQFYTEYVDIDGVVAQEVQNNDLTTLIAFKENNPFMEKEAKQAIERGINTIKADNQMLAQQLQAQRNNGHFVPVNIPAPQAPVMQPASLSYLTCAYDYVTTHKKTILTAGLTLGALGLAWYKAKSSMPVFSFWS